MTPALPRRILFPRIQHDPFPVCGCDPDTISSLVQNRGPDLLLSGSPPWAHPLPLPGPPPLPRQLLLSRVPLRPRSLIVSYLLPRLQPLLHSGARPTPPSHVNAVEPNPLHSRCASVFLLTFAFQECRRCPCTPPSHGVAAALTPTPSQGVTAAATPSPCCGAAAALRPPT